ncbi:MULTISPECIES: amidohydrolase family protein [Roseomonadaceae]|uniref:Adenosine deaminase domain-containing protein n=1 Tax=Falsiroseomonas oleicola TaxID=2801474 RepID=A0ABS6HFS3_9PROT|nr:hypothetical protein [Roseomonas oleicola]MBU8547259.1 hypothetical protein [Roseomonas oleicola]
MSALIFRRAFSDSFGLKELCKGSVPSMRDVRRRLFVAERRSDTRRADHFYKNYLDERLGQVEELHELPWAILSALAFRFIKRTGKTIHVRSEAWVDWQELLPMISPLAVLVAFLVDEGDGPDFQVDPRAYLTAEIGDSALLSTCEPEIRDLIEREGLNEMHMHLNGSTELDIVWPDAVRSPEIYLRELKAALQKSGEPTREFYDQLELGLTPYEIYRRLRSARRVRHITASILSDLKRARRTDIAMASILATMNADLADYGCSDTVGLPLSYRPISRMHPGSPSSPIIDEAAFLYSWFQGLRLAGGPKTQLGLALYFNMLVQTQISRISVQQIDEVGFDQFQKYTFVGVREHLERAYEARFRQLNGAPPHRVLKHLEGRLAPKKDIRDLMMLLAHIIDGYLLFRGCPKRAAARGLRGVAPGCLTGACCPGCSRPTAGRPDAELALVVHFIKRPSRRGRDRVPQALNMALRTDLRQQAQVVRQAAERSVFVRQILRGIDAAANELHAPPEVFAPTFRYLRRHGFQHSSFHVGEDFVHLVSGVRACDEAKSFLSLGKGDRMGHATALGIHPSLWRDRAGPKIMIFAGEHLDNLVYAHACLSARPETAAEALGLQTQIAHLSSRIYETEYSAASLYQAWLLRELDILEVLELERRSDIRLDVGEIAAAADDKAGRLNAPARRQELKRIGDAARLHPLAYSIYRERHRRGNRLDERMEVRTNWLTEAALTTLQANVLRNLADASIAIEVLPTSNVRISSYDRLDEHHLFRWLNLTADGFASVPAICVGSDDTGIFATNLQNEYAAIYDVLRRKFSVGPNEATSILEKLNRNGSAYRFRPISLRT